jgi:hypothetical protein
MRVIDALGALRLGHTKAKTSNPVQAKRLFAGS